MTKKRGSIRAADGAAQIRNSKGKILVTNLKQIRKEKGITQEELAKMVGHTRGYISVVETGRSRLTEDMKDKISKALNTDELTSYDEKSPKRTVVDTAGAMKRIRKVRGKLSQRAFAARVGCARGYVSDVENARINPSTDFLMKIAAACDVSYEWLLTGKEPNKEEIKQRTEQQMRVIDEYLRSNELARERVIAMIMDGSLGS